MYIIWSTKLQGWLTPNATYSSEIEDAKKFSRDEAIKACKSHFDKQDRQYGWLPVYLNDLEAVRLR